MLNTGVNTVSLLFVGKMYMLVYLVRVDNMCIFSVDITYVLG